MQNATMEAILGTAPSAEMGKALQARKLIRDQRNGGAKEPIYDKVVTPELLGPMTVLVDDIKCKQFAFTQDDYGSWYFRDSPFGKRIGHAAILANDLLQVYYSAYDRHRVVGIHTTEELEFVAPVFIGEQARITGRYVDKYERNGRGYVVMEAEARGEDGRLLLRHRGIEIMRIGRGVVGEGAPSRLGKKGEITGDFRTDLATAEHASSELAIGAGVTPLAKYITSDQMAVYSYIGEFQRNIHNDMEIARSVGLERPLCQGQQQVCFLTELLTRFFGASWFQTGRLKAKFIRPLLSESVFSVGGVVSGVESTEEGKRVHVEVWIDNGGHQLSSVGWASALICGQEARGSGHESLASGASQPAIKRGSQVGHERT